MASRCRRARSVRAGIVDWVNEVHEKAVACSLSAGAMAERQAELRAIFAGRVIEGVREGSALRLELHDSPGLGERVERVVELERACCPFLDIHVERRAGRLVVRIDGPPEAGPVLDVFAELRS